MSRLPDVLVQEIAAVACELSADQADALALDLEVLDSPKVLRKVAGLAAPRAVGELCEVWLSRPEVAGIAIADALRVSARAVKTTSSYEKVEALVTGPLRGDLRRSEQGLLEVIRSARARLWVVSYVLVGDMKLVVEALQERADAGVEVNVLLDHRPDSAAASFARLETDAPGCHTFIWPDQHREVGQSHVNLHAKCAVADGRQALVSSANLTEWAMGRNLEVGYLVSGGPTPRSLERYFDELLAAGEIESRPGV